MQHVQPRRHGRAETIDDQPVTGVDETALDDSTECCLTDIDTALAEAEQQQALRALQAIEADADLDTPGRQRALRHWEARYAHTGLVVMDCCGIMIVVGHR